MLNTISSFKVLYFIYFLQFILLTTWSSMLLLSFLIFKSNVSIINAFNHIFVFEVILKTRIIKPKRTTATPLNLILLSSCNYVRRFIWLGYNIS